MDSTLYIENNFNIKCIKRDLEKLSTIYRKEYLIEEIIKIINNIYNDNDDNIKVAQLPNYKI